jgi:predicted DCC family thiol-disulfide oxidoreductase YuxK
MSERKEHLVLYDGVCGLCNGFNRFILKRDKRDLFRFAALQGVLARDLLHRHLRVPGQLDTVCVIADHGQRTERVLCKSQAVLFTLKMLGGIWNGVRIFELLPTWVLDAGYDFVARHRYQWFGQYDQCLMPDPRYRTKFIDPG